MEKYIVELKKNETLYKAATRESDGTAYVCSAIGTPYTAPDLEQVRKEAYKDGYNAGFEKKIYTSYQEGLSDAWEAARKIYDISQEDRLEIFPEASTFVVADICDRYSASECIEKIRQYEQEKEEEIQVGDEVKNTQTDARFIVTHMWVNNHGEKGVSGFNYECSAFSTALDLVRKTGRHFPEIAEVFAKMKETDNG